MRRKEEVKNIEKNIEKSIFITLEYVDKLSFDVKIDINT